MVNTGSARSALIAAQFARSVRRNPEPGALQLRRVGSFQSDAQVPASHDDAPS
jgi:hypothetical protein